MDVEELNESWRSWSRGRLADDQERIISQSVSIPPDTTKGLENYHQHHKPCRSCIVQNPKEAVVWEGLKNTPRQPETLCP